MKAQGLDSATSSQLWKLIISKTCISQMYKNVHDAMLNNI